MGAVADKMKHGQRPPHKQLRLPKSSPASKEKKYQKAIKHFSGSSSVAGDTDIDDIQAGSEDRGQSPSESNAVSGLELAVLQNAEQLMYQRTLFVNAFPDIITLNMWVREVWEEAEGVLGKAEQSLKSRKEVKGPPHDPMRRKLNLLNSC